MVKMSVLADALKKIVNAEKAGKRQVNIELYFPHSLPVRAPALAQLLALSPPRYYAPARRERLCALLDGGRRVAVMCAD